MVRPAATTAWVVSGALGLTSLVLGATIAGQGGGQDVPQQRPTVVVERSGTPTLTPSATPTVTGATPTLTSGTPKVTSSSATQAPSQTGTRPPSPEAGDDDGPSVVSPPTAETPD